MTKIERSTEVPDESLRADLVGRMVELVYGATAPLRAWGRHFLLPGSQERDPELAAQAFSIFFVSLYDVCDLGSPKRLPKIVKEAQDRHFGRIAMAGEIFVAKSKFAARLLSQVPEDLQVVVRHYRDTVVHGPLGNYTNDEVSIKIAVKNEILVRRYSRREFQAIFRGCVEKYGDLGKALSEGGRILMANSTWLDEMEPLLFDPSELQGALMNGFLPLPWATGEQVSHSVRILRTVRP